MCRQPPGSSITTLSPVRLSLGMRSYPEQSIYSLSCSFFRLAAFATDVLVKLYLSFMICLIQQNRFAFPSFFSLQPSVELRLPSNPSGFARAPAADWPSTGHCGLCLRPQPAPHPPDAGLCYPEAHTWHPPLWAECQ